MARPIYVRFETPSELADKVLQLVQVASETGKVRVGTNEVTKSSERAEAKLVVMAEDIDPVEIWCTFRCCAKKSTFPTCTFRRSSGWASPRVSRSPRRASRSLEPGEAKGLLDELARRSAALKK